jgi:hypothetical protein
MLPHRVSGLLWVLLAGAAQAEPVTLHVQGAVDSVVDSHGLLDGSILVGTRLSAVLRYDTSRPDALADPSLGIYTESIPPGEFAIDVGNYAIDVPARVLLLVYDDYAIGNESFESFSVRYEGATFAVPGTPGASFDSLIFRIDAADTTAFASDALPESIDFDDFPNRSLTRFGIEGCLDGELVGFTCSPRSIQIYGVIDAVPESDRSAAAIAAIGALVIRRRRSRVRRG